jgi:hypothetical protein
MRHHTTAMVPPKLRSPTPWIGRKASSSARALPSTAGVDGERVEDDSRGGEAVECGQLRLEDGDEEEESLHGARRKEPFSLR